MRILCLWIVFYSTTTPCWARLGFPRYGRPSLVVLVLFQAEKNVNKRSIPPRKRKSIPAGRGSENGRGAGLRGPISNFVRLARRPRRCRPYLSFQLQIIQSSSSARERSSLQSKIHHPRESVPRNRGETSKIALPAPPLQPQHIQFSWGRRIISPANRIC